MADRPLSSHCRSCGLHHADMFRGKCPSCFGTWAPWDPGFTVKALLEWVMRFKVCACRFRRAHVCPKCGLGAREHVAQGRWCS